MFPRLHIPPNVTSLPLSQLLVLKLSSSDSELHLENEHLALVLPCLYHQSKFQAVLMINGMQTLPFSHSFPQSQIRLFYEGEQIQRYKNRYRYTFLSGHKGTEHFISKGECFNQVYNFFNQSTLEFIKSVCWEVTFTFKIEPYNMKKLCNKVFRRTQIKLMVTAGS